MDKITLAADLHIQNSPLEKLSNFFADSSCIICTAATSCFIRKHINTEKKNDLVKSFL